MLGKMKKFRENMDKWGIYSKRNKRKKEESKENVEKRKKVVQQEINYLF